MTKVRPVNDPRDKVAIGNRLQLTREALGLTQRQFAQDAGLKPSAYNQYETGYKKPSVDAANALCDRYKLTLDWIFRGDASGIPYETAHTIQPLRALRQRSA